jgi:hypothetical protein
MEAKVLESMLERSFGFSTKRKKKIDYLQMLRAANKTNIELPIFFRIIIKKIYHLKHFKRLSKASLNNAFHLNLHNCFII